MRRSHRVLVCVLFLCLSMTLRAATEEEPGQEQITEKVPLKNALMAEALRPIKQTAEKLHEDDKDLEALHKVATGFEAQPKTKLTEVQPILIKSSSENDEGVKPMASEAVAGESVDIERTPATAKEAPTPLQKTKAKVSVTPALPVAPVSKVLTKAETKPAPKAVVTEGEPVTAGVTAETSLRWLTNGNTRFMKKQFRADGRTSADRKRLTAGQKPHAIVLACSDSRVPPELVFDQALGEIVVIRTAGEALDSAVIASLEEAAESLDTHLLIVLGHSQCSTVESALKIKDGDSAGSAALDKLLADIRPRLKTVKSDALSENGEVEAALNADGVARDLLKRSELIHKKVKSGQLLIKPALYRTDTGKVTFY